MRPNILDLIQGNKSQNQQNLHEDGSLNANNLLNNLGSSRPSYQVGEQSMEGVGKPNPLVNLSEENTLKNDDVTQAQSTSMLNAVKQAWDNTQKSSYQSDLNKNQLIIDKNENLKEDWLKAKRLGQVDNQKLSEVLSKINEENAQAQEEVNKAQEGINTNQQEINSEYVSKMFKMKEALVNGKGANAGFTEAMEYTLPSGIGSMGSMMTQQLAATFGKKGIDKIVTAAVTGIAEGAEGGPWGSAAIGAATTLSQIALLWSARYGETKSEMGDNVEQAKQQLVQK